MTKMKNLRPTWISPGAILALGLGVAFGVILASGFHLDGNESARFLGGILGSLVAVSGAIALYYLKEKQDTQKIRERVVSSLRKLAELCEAARGQIEAETDMNITMVIVLEDYYKRAVEFISRFQFDNYLVAECYYSLTSFGGKALSGDGLDRPKPPTKEHLRIEVDYYQIHVNNALAAMHEKPSRDSNQIVGQSLARYHAGKSDP